MSQRLTIDDTILRSKSRVDQHNAKLNDAQRVLYDMVQKGLRDRLLFDSWGRHESRVAVFVLESLRSALQMHAAMGAMVNLDEMINGCIDMAVSLEGFRREEERETE